MGALGGATGLPELLPAWHHIMPAHCPPPGRKLLELGGTPQLLLRATQGPSCKGHFWG